MIYFKDGFYFDVIPDGAIEISEEQYAKLLAGQAQGKIIISNSKGEPVLTEPPPTDYHEWDGENGLFQQKSKLKLNFFSKKNA